MLLLFLIAAFTYFQTNSLESVFTTVIAVGALLLFIPLFPTYRRKQKTVQNWPNRIMLRWSPGMS